MTPWSPWNDRPLGSLVFTVHGDAGRARLSPAEETQSPPATEWSLLPGAAGRVEEEAEPHAHASGLCGVEARPPWPWRRVSVSLPPWRKGCVHCACALPDELEGCARRRLPLSIHLTCVDGWDWTPRPIVLVAQGALGCGPTHPRHRCPMSAGGSLALFWVTISLASR